MTAVPAPFDTPRRMPAGGSGSGAHGGSHRWYCYLRRYRACVHTPRV